MSKKRREKKARDKELARQLQGSGDVDVASLAEKPRVAEPQLKSVSVRCERALPVVGSKPPTMAISLFLVERHQARLVGAVEVEPRGRAGADGPVDALVRPVSVPDVGEDGRVRYTRPAHFVVVLAPTVLDAESKLVVDGETLAIGASALSSEFGVVRGTTHLDIEAAFVALTGNDRIKDEVSLPLHLGRARLEYRVRVVT